MTTPTVILRPLLSGFQPDKVKIQDLPFVAKKRPDGEPGRWFWNVRATGRYDADCVIGKQYAMEAIHYMRTHDAPFLLTWIVLDMPARAEWTGVDVGFLHTIGDLISSG